MLLQQLILSLMLDAIHGGCLSLKITNLFRTKFEKTLITAQLKITTC